VVLTGAGRVDRGFEKQARTELAALPIPVEVEYVSGLSMPATLQMVRELDSRTLVFTPGYFQDGEGRNFLPRESAGLIARASGAPVYGPYNTFIGTGVVGGTMPTYTDMGRLTGLLLNELLAGRSRNEVAQPESVPIRIQLDWRELQRWGVDVSRVPDGSVFHFREPTLWEQHRNTILLAIAIIVLQAGLIAALLLERRQRKRVASALAASEERMSLAARAARLSMWAWDVARERVWLTGRPDAPSGPLASLSLDVDEVVKRVHPVDRDAFIRSVREAADKQQELDIEYRVVEPDGEVRWMAARGRAEAPGERRLAGVTMDITARKEAELQAQRDRSALTHMSRVSMMGQLSASIAHQLNQPLAAILGNAEAAQKMLTHDRPDLVELDAICNDIITQNHRAAEVIRRLSALYKRGETKRTPLDLNELVRETLELVRTEMMTRHVVATCTLADALPMVDGERIQLQQVLINLILNAADAMKGVPPEARRLLVETARDDDHVVLRVTDNGSGIAAGDLKSVFDAFWSTKEEGMGIGLAICHAIIAAHDGTLIAGNNPSGGATFVARWPMRARA
jgi:C4-dicarboxylate-specific signal transduction histidine kinase